MSNTHMDVIIWPVRYFGVHCISYYIALLICPALAALNKRKYLLSLSLPVFYMLCLAGRFSTPGIIYLDSALC